MAFTLPASCRAKEGQVTDVKGDVQEEDAPSASMVIEEDGPQDLLDERTELESPPEDLPKDQVKSKDIGDIDERTHVILLKPKKTGDGISKPMKVVLERPSPRMARHLKPLYISAHFDGLPIDRVLVDGGSAINVMPQSMLRTLRRSLYLLKSTCKGLQECQLEPRESFP